MTTVETIRVGPDWLDLRERADAAARSRALVEQLRRRLPANGPLLVHDLASGTGSMRRWLAPLLPGPQHWVLHDRDPGLLALAESPGGAAGAARRRAGACSGRMRGKRPSRASAGWEPRSLCARARGGSAPRRATSRASGSPAGSTPPANRTPR